MGASNSTGKAQIYKLKIQKETGVPKFVQQEKNDEAWEDTKSFSDMEGYLKSISMEQFTWEGKTKNSLKVIMTDNVTDEKIIITMYMDNATRSMLNSLAGAEDLSGVLRLEARKYGKTEKKYPTIFVKMNGNQCRWKYPIDEIPKIIETKNSRDITVDWDDSDANEFFKLVIERDINPRLQSEPQYQPTQPSYSQPREQTPQQLENFDDLPF